MEAGVTKELGNPGSISHRPPPGATSTPLAQTPRGAADARSHSERGAGAVPAPLPSQQHRVCSSQPACARDTELPVETDGTALEAIQEALQGIGGDFLTRGYAAETLRQQQRVPSVVHASCRRRDKWPVIIVIIVITVTAAAERYAPPSQRAARRCGSKAGRESAVQTATAENSSATERTVAGRREPTQTEQFEQDTSESPASRGLPAARSAPHPGGCRTPGARGAGAPCPPGTPQHSPRAGEGTRPSLPSPPLPTGTPAQTS